MDRLIALVELRWRLSVRSYARARERAVGLILMLPGLLAFSVGGSLLAFFGLRALEGRAPEAVLPLVSAAATLVGAFWALSPLLAGVAFVESHDLSRLLHFPVPLTTLVVSSLVANLLQPTVLAEVPIFLAFSLGVCGLSPRLIPGLAGAALSLALVLALAQACGLLLHGLARNRRFQDLALFLGLGVGFLFSLLPILVMVSGGGSVRAIFKGVVATDVFVLSPFSWGLRATIHAGRGELASSALWIAAAAGALATAVAASAVLVHRIYRGELDVSPARREGAGRARMIFRGELGTLLEKDLRVSWREPAVKATLIMSLFGPLFMMFFLSRAGAQGHAGSVALGLGSFVGLSTFGSNAFGLERRGISLLLGFPVERWRILVGKNLAALLFRLPGILALLVVGAFVAPLEYLPAALTIALVTFSVCVAMDNYVSVLFPVPVPAPGANPYGGPAAGGRGLGVAALGAVLLMVSLLVSSPFVFLAWLPLLLGTPPLWLVTLPLALAGGGAVYAMLVGGAARLLSRREPELLERILWDV